MLRSSTRHLRGGSAFCLCPKALAGVPRHLSWSQRGSGLSDAAGLTPQAARPSAAPIRRALLDVLEPDRVPSDTVTLVPATSTAASSVARGVVADDDFVVDDDATPALDAVAVEREEVPKNLLELVTDEFAQIKERELARRRAILYELTHPKPQDYTYNGKLVPPPPIAFGRLTEEGLRLGRQMFVEQTYSLVRESKPTDYFFEINDLYMEVAFLGKANAGKSSLINALCQQEMAKTSSLPNSTRTINFYQSATPEEIAKFVNGNPSRLVKLPAGGLQLTLVDVPGFGIPGMSDAWREHAIRLTDSYLGTRRSLNTVFLCIDASKGLTKGDEKYFSWIENLHGMFYVLLTKCDAVPHARVCTLMRQLYQLMTKHRKKNRKAFPFVLPVSSHTGANIDELRALIVETSGLISGDKMRALLQKQASEQLVDMQAADAQRVAEAWDEHRQTAKLEFLESRGLLPAASAATVDHTGPDPPDAISGEKQQQRPAANKKVVVTIPNAPANPLAPAMAAKWRGEAGYGMRLRFNTGLEEAPVQIDLGGDDGDQDEVGGEAAVSSIAGDSLHNDPPLKAAGPSGAGDESGANSERRGPVSEFLAALDAQLTTADPEPKHPALKKREERLKRRSAMQTKGTRVFVENDDGALRQLKCGRAVGPTMPKVDMLESRFTQLQTRRFMKEAMKKQPTQPWRAVRNAVSQMSRQELNSYAKNSGRVEGDRKKFEASVDGRKWENENRFVETAHKQSELHTGLATRISFTSQPPGLLKKYAEQDKYWIPDSVLGLPSAAATTTATTSAAPSKQQTRVRK